MTLAEAVRAAAEEIDDDYYTMFLSPEATEERIDYVIRREWLRDVISKHLYRYFTDKEQDNGSPQH